MKQLIYILTFLTFLISSEFKAQKTERFYNYLWKECPPNESGELMADTTCTDRQAQFVGGIDAWIKFISKHIYFPSQYRIVNADVAKVVVTFTVNEEGEVENVFTSTPFDKVFDSIAEKAIKKSPKWIPAIKHNRRVKTTLNQVVNFQNYIE